jgi:hypothetical protein
MAGTRRNELREGGALSGSWMKPLFVHCSLLTILVLLSGCPRERPRPKVANPMIDSAEKFTVVYTETVPTQTGLDAFLGILGSKKDSADTSAKDTTQSVATGESAAEAKSEVRSEESERKVSQGTEGKTRDGEDARVLLVPDTGEPVYSPGTVEMICFVRYVGVEGGFWGLVGENGQNYDPLNLPDKLKYGGLRVRFWLRIRNDIATAHMWGAPVQVVAYSMPKG